jgi:hypothetical protein
MAVVMAVIGGLLLEMALAGALVVILALAVMQGMEMVALDNPVLVVAVVAVLIKALTALAVAVELVYLVRVIMVLAALFLMGLVAPAKLQGAPVAVVVVQVLVME